jgi:hypothetical protein
MKRAAAWLASAICLVATAAPAFAQYHGWYGNRGWYAPAPRYFNSVPPMWQPSPWRYPNSFYAPPRFYPPMPPMPGNRIGWYKHHPWY